MSHYTGRIRPFAEVTLNATIKIVALGLFVSSGYCFAADNFAPPTAPAAPQESAETVDALFQKLVAPERFGQLMIVTATGRNSPSPDDFAYMQKCPPGAVIIQQILRPGDASSYVSRLRQLELGTGIPLWIGANMYRLAQRDRTAVSAFPQAPSMLSVGAADDDAITRSVAGLIGDEMRSMGFDLYVGPSLVLAPGLPEAHGSIYTFGSDPARVASAAAATISVLTEKGLLPMPTGFPGGGLDRTANSAAVLLTPEPLLSENELVPYKRAIDEGVGILLVDDTLVPTLDPLGRPACLAADVMRNLLRGQMGFEGVIVAGPIDGANVANLYDPADAAVAALEAGADMVYWNQGGGQVLKGVMKIEEAVASGRLSEAALNASLRRVLALKVAHRVQRLAPQSEERLNRLSSKRDYREVCFEAERRSITLVRNTNDVLPLRKGDSPPVLVTGTTGVTELRGFLEKHLKPVAEQRIATGIHLGEIERFEVKRLTDHLEGVRTVICVLTNEEAADSQANVVREMQKKGARVVVILLGYPRNLPRLAHADGILVAYSDPFTLKETIRAVAEVLLGEAAAVLSPPAEPQHIKVGTPYSVPLRSLLRAPGGRLPVRVSDAFPAGLAQSYAPDALFKKVEWDFGDGARSKDVAPSHTYAAPGQYTVAVNVTDQTKNVASAQWTLQVEE